MERSGLTLTAFRSAGWPPAGALQEEHLLQQLNASACVCLFKRVLTMRLLDCSFNYLTVSGLLASGVRGKEVLELLLQSPVAMPMSSSGVSGILLVTFGPVRA